MSIKYGSSLLAGMPDVEKLLDSTSFTGTPTVPTATVGDNSKQIANTEFVQNAISNFSTSGAYKVGTRNWTYEQWKQYASTNVSTSYNPNFDVEGIKVGDIGYVYGTVSDRNNIQALMVGIVTNTDNYPTSINIQSLGLSIQNMDLIDSIMSSYTETTVDNTSISYNDDNNLQVNGVVERNKGIVNYDWVGTLSEYQEQDIENQHPEWICYITDDNDIPSVSIDSYTKTETDELLEEKANVSDVYTKTETDELLNVASNDSEKTNCITEIPQDINLELVDGTLTLKAGSKVYDANGNIININNDLSIGNYGSASTQLGICVNSSGSELVAEVWSYSVSGTTAPTSGFIYNTDTNVISRYSDSTETHTNLSFPICTVSRSSGTLTSIDQVFNGFGYIGSTVFALPGVKGLIPNGRNEDGTLRNVEITINNLITYTSGVNAYGYYFTDGNQIYWIAFANEYYEQENMPSGLPAVDKYGLWYNPDTNIMLRSWNNEAWTKANWTKIGSVNGTNNKIISFNPKTTFHTVDYNDKSTIVGWGIPDYSAGVSKTGTWTAEYAGVYVIRFGAVEAGSAGHFTINGATFYSRTYNLEEQQTITALVGKGDVVVLHSANIGAIFYPLKGVK